MKNENSVRVLTISTPASKITQGGTGSIIEYFDLYRKKFA